MTAINDFLAMGGYAGFVWPAFGLAAAVLVALWLGSHRRLRASRRALSLIEPERRTRGGEP